MVQPAWDKPRERCLAQLQDTVRGALLNSPTGFDRVPVGSSSTWTPGLRGDGQILGRRRAGRWWITLLAEVEGPPVNLYSASCAVVMDLAYETQIKR